MYTTYRLGGGNISFPLEEGSPERLAGPSPSPQSDGGVTNEGKPELVSTLKLI